MSLIPGLVYLREASEGWERQLSRLWWERRWGGDWLVTTEGERLQVVYPGKPAIGGGPDFQGAILATEEGELRRGDVELHYQARDWWAHGHQRDSRYNGVVLHVVLWDQGLEAVPLENGGIAAMLSLHPYLEAGKERGERGWPCRGAGEDRDLALLLPRLGEERFQEKAALLEAELDRDEPPQVLYRGLMGALGYARNKEAFRQVANLAPLRALEGYVQGKRGERGLLLLEALLLGTAGLLPARRGLPARGPEAELERVWSQAGNGDALSPGDWRFAGVRPENYPPRRLAAAAQLLWRYVETGLLEGLLSRLEAASLPGEVEKALLLPAWGYWAGHYDFGKAFPRALPSLLGRGRAREMVVNILLPFAQAWAGAESPLGRKALALYRNYPPGSENEVTRRMSSLLGLRPEAVRSTCSQQGLLHLEKRYCLEGLCACCPVRLGSPD